MDFRELVLGPYAILLGEIRCVGKLLVRIIHPVSFGRDLRYRFLAIATQSARVRTLETMPSMEMKPEHRLVNLCSIHCETLKQ